MTIALPQPRIDPPADMARATEHAATEHHSDVVVAVHVRERAQLVDRLGHGALDDAITTRLRSAFRGATVLTHEGGRFLLRLPGRGERTERHLAHARERFRARPVVVDGESLDLTTLVGYAELGGATDELQARRHALDALETACSRADLVPVAWTPSPHSAHTPLLRRGVLGRRPFVTDAVLTALVGLVVPYLLYWVAGLVGLDAILVAVVYRVVSTMMTLTTLVIYLEMLFALDPLKPPRSAPTGEAASAVIAAYLPNEAATIVETVRSFLAQQYSGPYQVVLAYNSPVRLPVEDTLAALADADPRLVLLRVDGSTSKAQNVNAALDVVTGTFVGIFDADHHPAQGSFERAWRWIHGGAAVVQGHCLVRNGGASRVARAVAVEFESIYAVSHPGRLQLHGFGIFGGSNGYWRTDLLRSVRMRGTMLTEDIDSSLRVVLRGERIVNDPGLVSRELAPATVPALVAQRLRWAQGWSQVSRRYLPEALRSRRLTVRQKAGAVFLLGWREAYPWVSLQTWPLLTYALLHRDVVDSGWFAPSLVLATVFAACAGPSQALAAFVLGAPEVTRRRGWVGWYALVSVLGYTELKNVIARVGHLRELLGEAEWRVTPRETS